MENKDREYNKEAITAVNRIKQFTSLGNNVILHITHDDGDAVGCALVLETFTTTAECVHVFCSVTKATDIMNDIIDLGGLNNTNVTQIIVSDISISPELGHKLNAGSIDLKSFDHHPTNPNRGNPWLTLVDEPVGEGEDARLISAAAIMLNEYDCGTPMIPESHLKKLRILINDISRYDTWEWMTHPEDSYYVCNPDSAYREDLIAKTTFILGPEEVFKLTYDTIVSDGWYPCPKELISIYRAERIKEKADIEFCKKFVKVIDYDGIKFAAFFAESNWNSVASYINDKYGDDGRFDAVMVLRPNERSIAFRSAESSSFNCCTFAKERFNGGGHVHAAGCGNIYPDEYLHIMEQYFNSEDYVVD